jgi:hypothetical protein
MRGAFFAIDAAFSGMHAAFFTIDGTLSGMHDTFFTIDGTLSGMHDTFFAIAATFFSTHAAFFATRLTWCDVLAARGDAIASLARRAPANYVMPARANDRLRPIADIRSDRSRRGTRSGNLRSLQAEAASSAGLHRGTK